MRELNSTERVEVAGGFFPEFFRTLCQCKRNVPDQSDSLVPGNTAGMGEIFGAAFLIGAAAVAAGGYFLSRLFGGKR
jgi:hypothetical protein